MSETLTVGKLIKELSHIPENSTINLSVKLDVTTKIGDIEHQQVFFKKAKAYGVSCSFIKCEYWDIVISGN